MVQKVKQVIWVPTDLFARIADISATSNLAPNTVIAELIARALTNTWEPIKVVEKEKVGIQKRYLCAECLQEFISLQEARRHKCIKQQKEVQQSGQ